jgi:MFS family permease
MADETSRRTWVGYGWQLVAVAVVISDFSVSAAVLPNIVADLHVTVGSASLALTIYLVVAASLIIVFGKLGDTFGRRRLVVAGAALSAAGSLVSAAAPNLGVFLLSRVLLGAAFAATFPAVLGLLNSTFGTESSQRRRAFAVWGIVVGLGAVIGPLIGGLSAGLASWRWAYLIDAAVAVLTIAGLLVTVPPDPPSRGSRRFDLLGTLLLTLGTGALVYVTDAGTNFGWLVSTHRPQVLGARWPLTVSVSVFVLAVGVGSFVAFWLVERRRMAGGRDVIVELSLFRIPSFSAAALASGLMNFGDTGLQLLVPLHTELVFGYGEVRAGLTLAAFGLGVALGGVAAPRLQAGLGERTAALGALVVLPLSLIALVPFVTASGSGGSFAFFLALYGAAWGIAYSTLVKVNYREIPARLSSAVGGMQSMIRLVAGALGTAILIGVFTSVSLGHVDDASRHARLTASQREAFAEVMQRSSTTNGGYEGLGIDSRGLTDPEDQRSLSRPPATVAIEVKNAVTAGTRVAILVAVAVSLLAVVTAAFVPRRSDDDDEGEAVDPRTTG